jgi:alpha-mannosidase
LTGHGLDIELRCARLAERLAEVELWLDRESVDIVRWAFDGEPLSLLDAWPCRHDVHTLRASAVSVPGRWPLAETRIDLDVGGEALVEIAAGADSARFGLDPYHHRFPVTGRTVDLTITAVARRPFGEPNREPRLARARLCWVDDVVERFGRQLRLILEAAMALRGDESVDPLLSCAERALSGIEWPSASSDYVGRFAGTPRLLDVWELPTELELAPSGLSDAERDSVAAAADGLGDDLRAVRQRYPPRGALALTGLAHIDLAWLWPLEETRRKARRTFWTAVNLMSSYPEFTFNQSSAQLYAFVEEDDPALLGRITERVDSGQWEPIGGMWVETDGNLPSGESLVRQLLYGQRYFKRAFGAYHRVGWLPDTFGLSPGLPQLLRGAGIDSLFAQKLNRSESNRFPFDLYWWEGVDGSRVLVHGFENPENAYDAVLGPEPMVRTWENFRAKQLHHESLLSIGYGDGGGGPTEEMIERARAMESFPALPAVRFGRVDDYFDRVRGSGAADALPVWAGELYLELHRGTFTTQGRLKWLHRRAERDLVAAEVVASLAGLTGGPAPSSLEAQWRVLLRNEFHDILPGSSIAEVNATAEAELKGVVDATHAVIDRGLAELSRRVATPGDVGGVLVVNPDLSPRPLRIELADRPPGAQPVEGGAVIAGERTVEGLEVAVVVDPQPVPGLECSAAHLENRFVRVELDRSGALARVYDKVAGRDVLAGRANQLWAYVDKPRKFDAWDIDESYPASGREIDDVESIEVVEFGPHRAAVRIRRRHRDSSIVQDVRLWSNSPRIEFRTTLDWHDRRWLLKARFPLAVRASHAVYETAFGVIDRPTHRNTSWDAARFEVPGHRFVDLSESGYGVALLNDGRYGHHAVGNELGISLLRSPIYPDPLADEGHHEFTYALCPHVGSWQDAGVLAEAEDLNRPLLARSVKVAGGGSLRPVRVSGIPVALGTLKASEDGDGYVMRCYEPFGARGAVRVEVPAGWVADRELDLLEADAGPRAGSFTPFQVRTWAITNSR